MNKNFITTRSITLGVLIAGGTIMINSSSIDSYSDTLYPRYSKKCDPTRNTDKFPVKLSLESYFNDITPLSALAEDSEVLYDFAQSMIANSKPLPADISKLIDDNFWDLL